MVLPYLVTFTITRPKLTGVKATTRLATTVAETGTLTLIGDSPLNPSPLVVKTSDELCRPVVLKLLEIVQPHFAYFGRKDAQQARIVQQMARDLNLDTDIVVCPIVREADGLALSSRNAYLSTEERKAATVLYKALLAAKEKLSSGTRDSQELQGIIHKILAGEPLARVDYVEIVDADRFEPVVRTAGRSYILLAVRVGKTRLIDNLLVEPAGEGLRVEL